MQYFDYIVYPAIKYKGWFRTNHPKKGEIERFTPCSPPHDFSNIKKTNKINRVNTVFFYYNMSNYYH